MQRQKWGELEQMDRHRLLLEALDPATSQRAFSREHGLARSHLRRLLAELTTDPERKLDEARREAEFRRQVLEAIRRRR